MRVTLRPLGLLLATLVLVASVEAQRPEVYYYRLNEGSGMTTNDLANPGLLGVTASVGNGASWNSNLKKLGSSCVQTLIATGVPVQANKKFTIPSGDWSIELWAFDNDSATPTATRYLFGDASANSLRCFRGGAAGANNLILQMNGMNDVVIPGGAPLASWAHICFVYDSRDLTITPYLNGVALPSVQQDSLQPILGTVNSGLDMGGYGNNLPWFGLIDEVRVWDHALTAAEVAGQMNGQLNNQVTDMGVTSITAPLSDSLGCGSLSASETISFEIENTGTTAMPAGTAFQATYTINGGLPVTENFLTTNTLTIGMKEIQTFATPVNMAITGTYLIDVSLLYGFDLITLNNSRSRTVASGGQNLVTTFPYFENFDSLAVQGSQIPPAGWRQDLTDGTGADADWYFRGNATPTAGTGPSADHSGGGFYAYTSDTGSVAAINLISPCMDFSLLSSPRVKLWVHSLNSAGLTNENFLSVDVISFPGGTVTMDVIGPIGTVNNSWNEYVVDLPAFFGQTVQIQIRGRTDGGGTTHDIAIDDIAVFNYVPGIGQAPLNAVAMLDISEAKSPGLSGVQSLDNGPYTTSIAGGEFITFKFAGEANQPVVLLFGALNPAAASFPGIGQLDIGGPIDPTTGVPTFIQVFADGTIPMGFNPFFNTGPAAENSIYFTMPAFPSGPLTTFQGIYFWSGGVAISNAVDVVIP